MFDAIVVGARCAGSPTAMLLARMGYRVLLLDKARFPSDTLSVHYIHQPGVASLQRWGLLEGVIASNCPPVRRQRVDFGPVVLEATPPPIDGIADAYAPRRTVLDTLLVEAAAAAGAEVRERFTVEDLLMDGERVTGIQGHSTGGAMVREEARIVIGLTACTRGSPAASRPLPTMPGPFAPALTTRTGPMFRFRVPNSISGQSAR